MRTLLLFLALLAISSCSCVATQPSAPAEECKVGILVDHGQFGWKSGNTDGFYWAVWFTNHSDLPDLIQEIDFESGEHLVEVFAVAPEGCVHDHHTISLKKHARSMFIYPGEAVGLDRRNGWGHVPQNLDGSVVTNSNVNWDYQVAHKTQGRVIKERRNQGIYWTLSISQGKMVVTIGGKP